MINKPFDDIRKEDVDALLAEERREGLTIEYKDKLPTNQDEEIREFFADISSFANAAGGDLIYGIQDKRDEQGKSLGIPGSITGLEGINVDAEKLRLESKIRDNIDPRIINIRMEFISGFEKGPVLIIRIPKSWNSPHMVTFKNLSRFFSRNSGGKYQFNVTEIRAAFIASETLTERITRFRDDRISKINAGETPVMVSSNPKVILHILPLAAFDPTLRKDVISAASKKIVSKLSKCNDDSWTRWYWSTKYNFEGFVAYQEYATRVNSNEEVEKKLTEQYIQIFRTGAIEFLIELNLSERVNNKTGKQQQTILSRFLEGTVINEIVTCMSILEVFNIYPPAFIFITLLGVNNYALAYEKVRSFRWMSQDEFTYDPVWLSTDQINRDIVPLPELAIYDYSQYINNYIAVGKLLRSSLDTLWQTAGEPENLLYDDEGRWRGMVNFPKNPT